MKHETLYHTYAKKPCGYCKQKGVSITVPQLKKKECLKKQCWHLVKYDHEYWTQREAIKKKKKENKKKRDEKIKALTIPNYSVELRSDSI